MKTEDDDTRPFWVGIGASAGGLEALRAMAKNISPKIGAIYVVVQHMSPQHKSLLTELIGRETELEVVEIRDRVLPVPNTIYVGPPNSDIVIQGGRLRLQAPSTEHAAPKPSVDRFFRSLAEHFGDHAVGVVLSGTGSDGAYGVQAIRAAGGITIAQDQNSAKYHGMPGSAIETGCVDLVLSPEQIGSQFAKITKLPRDLASIEPIEAPLDQMSELFQLLDAQTGVDFRDYKPSTIRRRIERRMHALDLFDLDQYLTYVREEPEELNALFRDMMISVTSFFRDADEFDLLRQQLEKSDLNEKKLRVWVPGCATGEEAYSIAILITELIGGIDALEKVSLQVFATDIDTNALGIARRGFYPEAAIDDVPSDLRETYFTRMPGGFAVNHSIRERVVFTPHNLCQDPPFSNIDLVSCRNLLIYFGSTLQNKVMARLHYALNSNGLLFLGKSEAIGGAEDLFRPASNSAHLFVRRATSDGSRQRHGVVTQAPGRLVRHPSVQDTQREFANLSSMFESLVRAVGPNCLLVTSDLHIRRVYGNIDKYVSLSEGMVRGATISMLRDTFRHEVRTLIAMAMRHGASRSGAKHRLTDPANRLVQLDVHPLNVIEGNEALMLVVFREWEETPRPVALPDEDDQVANHRITELEEELDDTRESLQQTVEELETTNEELQSLNEEMQSANEELQSTNEELETANEELQSTNEELITVNEELQINSQELTLLNQELDSILANIAAPILVVDNGLHIIRCSQSAREMFQIELGVGKPHLSQSLLPEGFPSLSTFMAEIIRTGTKMECEIETPTFQGSVMAAPYFNPKGELIGATAIITNTAELQVRRELEMLLNNVPVLIWHKDDQNTILNLNEAAAKSMGLTRAEAIGKNHAKLIGEIASKAANEDLTIIERGVPKLGTIEKIRDEAGEPVWIRKDKVPYSLPEGRRGIYVVAQDITPEFHARIELVERQDRLDSILDALPVGVDFIDNERILHVQNLASRQLTETRDLGWDWNPLEHVEWLGESLAEDPTLHALRGETPPVQIFRARNEDGTARVVQAASVPVIGRDGGQIGAISTSVDLTAYADRLGLLDTAAGPQASPSRSAPGAAGWRLDARTGTLEMTPEADTVLGLTRKAGNRDLDHLLKALHKDDRHDARHGISTVLAEAIPFTVLARRTANDQQIVLSARAERTADGTISGVVGLVFDAAADATDGADDGAIDAASAPRENDPASPT